MRSKMEQANMASSAPPLYEEAMGQPAYPTGMSMPMPMPMPMNDQQMSYGQPQPYPYHHAPPPQGQHSYDQYGQQQVHYPPAQVQPTIVLTQTAPVIFGSHSQHMICPSCHSEIASSVVSESNYMTHLVALGLCFFGCILCSCLPYCMDSCKNISHYCPNCKAYLGTYNRNL